MGEWQPASAQGVRGKSSCPAGVELAINNYAIFDKKRATDATSARLQQLFSQRSLDGLGFSCSAVSRQSSGIRLAV